MRDIRANDACDSRLFDGSARDQKHLVDRARLADAIDPPYPLFDARGCPRHFEMNDEPTSLLKVEPLAGCVGGEQHTPVAGGELPDRVGPFGRRQAPVQLTCFERAQFSLERRERVAVFSEDDRRLLRATEEARKRAELAFCPLLSDADARCASAIRASRARRSLSAFSSPGAPTSAPGSSSSFADRHSGSCSWTSSVAPTPSSASRRSSVRSSEDALLQARRVRMIIARRAAGDAGWCQTRRTYAVNARCICASASVGRTRSQRVRRPARVRGVCACPPEHEQRKRLLEIADGRQALKRDLVAGVRRCRQHHDRSRALRQQRGCLVPVRLAGDAMGFVDDQQIPDEWFERSDHLRALDVVGRRQDEWVHGPRIRAVGDAAARRSAAASSTTGAR